MTITKNMKTIAFVMLISITLYYYLIIYYA